LASRSKRRTSTQLVFGRYSSGPFMNNSRKSFPPSAMRLQPRPDQQLSDYLSFKGPPTPKSLTLSCTVRGKTLNAPINVVSTSLVRNLVHSDGPIMCGSAEHRQVPCQLVSFQLVWYTTAAQRLSSSNELLMRSHSFIPSVLLVRPCRAVSKW
jgi:hypothetical protein